MEAPLHNQALRQRRSSRVVEKRRHTVRWYGAVMARPRQFDEQVLLDTATDLFWSRGFDGTSVEDVSAATGVGNGSIYSAYGSKMGLFLVVFERYCEQRAAFVEDVVGSAEGSARDAVRAFFEAIIADCAAQPGRRGCLMINSMSLLGPRVPEVAALSVRSTDRMELSLAVRLGELLDRPPAELSATSAHLVLVSQGLIQLSRRGVSRERLREIASVSASLVPDDVAA
jgi:AcrR family transcriptional regulator